MSYVFAALVVALVVIYMAQPSFRRTILSAALFFEDDPVVGSTSRIAWSTPRPTPLFYLQLAVLLLVLLALPHCRAAIAAGDTARAGVWVFVDRSASMSTIQNGGTRMDRAVAELKTLLAAQPATRCFRLTAFDMELATVADSISSVAELADAASRLRPRALGTSVSLVERALASPPTAGCPADTAVIVTDMPAPAWMDGANARRYAWIDVSEPVGNAGLTDLVDTRDPVTGKVARVTLRLETFGPMKEKPTVTVTAPDGRTEVHPAARWDGPAGFVELTPALPGRYAFHVTPGGAYAYDDDAAIDIPAAGPVRVQWDAPNRDWIARLGWQEDRSAPDLRVVASAELLDSRPAIVAGPGYSRRGVSLQPVATFAESSPLVAGLNLDVAERAGLSAAPALPPGFNPVLSGRDGAVWIAERPAPLAVYVPGLPIEGEDTLARFSATVFFNAARWILQRRPLPPLFTLTSPDAPEPSGSRIALHQGEGNSGRTPRSAGRLDVRSRGGRAPDRQRDLWPWLVAAAAAVFLAERGLALVRGLS